MASFMPVSAEEYDRIAESSHLANTESRVAVKVSLKRGSTPCHKPEVTVVPRQHQLQAPAMQYFRIATSQ